MYVFKLFSVIALAKSMPKSNLEAYADKLAILLTNIIWVETILLGRIGLEMCNSNTRFTRIRVNLCKMGVFSTQIGIKQ